MNQETLARPAHAFAEDGNTPYNARVLNPLNGTLLMRETEGYFCNLFPTINDTGVLVPGLIDVTNQLTLFQAGRVIPEGTFLAVPISGDRIFFNFVNDTIRAMRFRLRMNEKVVLEWMPLAAASLIQGSNPVFEITFSAVDILHPAGSGQGNDAACNAIIGVGRNRQGQMHF